MTMDEAERQAWLTMLPTVQLRALCCNAGVYFENRDQPREKLISVLAKVNDIAIPRETV
jgi:hypothetical protein